MNRKSTIISRFPTEFYTFPSGIYRFSSHGDRETAAVTKRATFVKAF